MNSSLLLSATESVPELTFLHDTGFVESVRHKLIENHSCN